MTRREQIENIIVGTLLNSDEKENYFENVKSCVTSDMFSDKRNAEIFDMISEMNSKGLVRTWPDALFNYSNHTLKTDMLSHMVDLATNWFFFVKKVEYNDMIWRTETTNPHKRYTHVTFDDYVSKFLQMALI